MESWQLVLPQALSLAFTEPSPQILPSRSSLTESTASLSSWRVLVMPALTSTSPWSAPATGVVTNRSRGSR